MRPNWLIHHDLHGAVASIQEESRERAFQVVAVMPVLRHLQAILARAQLLASRLVRWLALLLSSALPTLLAPLAPAVSRQAEQEPRFQARPPLRLRPAVQHLAPPV